MAVNISLFNGVPTTYAGAVRQFKQLYEMEKKRAFNRGRYLVLKRLKEGMYKGYWSTFVYETKPKTKYLMIRRFPNG